MSKKLLFVAMLALIAVVAFAQPWPPMNLEANVMNQTNVQLNWGAPQNPDSEELRWDDGVNDDGIGTNAAADFDVAARFDTSDLSEYDGMSLTQVGFFPRYQSCEYSIRVWTGGSLNGTTLNPGDMIIDQAVTNFTINEWNYVTLSTPVTIDAEAELWFGYRANTTGDHPAGCDAGPQVAYKGNLIYYQNAWAQLTDLNDALTYNWNIVGMAVDGRIGGELVPLASTPRAYNNSEATFEQAFEQVASPRDRDLTGYKIYRDDSELATVDAETLTYMDEDLADGTYEYYVTAIWDEGESDPSNTVEVTIQDMGYALFEDFENGAMPAGWSQEHVVGTVDWTFQAGGNSGHPAGAYSGSYNAYIYAGNYDGNTTQLITPALNLTGQPVLTFYHTQAVWSGDQDSLTLYYRVSDTDDWVELETWTSDISAWTMEQITLPNPSATYQLCFEALLDYGYGVCIDDVAVTGGEPGETGTIDGTVTDAETNSPIQGAVVVCGTASGTTNASGEYSFEVNVGTYDVTCSATGYSTATEEDVVISVDQATTVDFALNAISDYPAPGNFEAEVQNDVNVHLTWTSPYTELRWDDGVNVDGIGTNAAADFVVAHRFDTSDLAAYDGMTLSQIGFFPRYADCVYAIRVWTGGSYNGSTFTEGDMVVDQTVQVTPNEWNYFALDTPVAIDESEELWFGYRANTQGDHPCGVDAGPQVSAKGNLVKYGGSWSELVDLNDALTNNWNIVGYASGGRAGEELLPLSVKPLRVSAPMAFERDYSDVVTPEPINRNRDLDGYKIYRDGNLVGTVNDPFTLEYTEEGLEPGTYTYYATAIYNGGNNESNPSNSDEVTIIELTYDEPENLHATVNGNNVLLQWDAPGTNQPPVENIDEGFESGEISDDWQNVDVDGDGYYWEIADEEYGTHTGDYCVASASYINEVGALNPDNWLITPPIAIQNGFEISLWMCAQDPEWPAEHFEVLLSTGGMNPNDFTETLIQETLTDGDWHEFTADLSSWADQNCRLAFVHCDVSDMYWIKMDDVYVNNARGEVVYDLVSDSKKLGTLKDDGNIYIVPSIDRDRPTLDSYNIYRDGAYLATQNNVNITVYNDVNVPDGTYEYYVTAVYTDGNESGPSNTIQIIDNNNNTELPAFTELNGNYPNPFNPVTNIFFSLSDKSEVTIEVYNLKGQLVRTLVNETMNAGDHKIQWTGDDNHGKDVGSGVYFYKMRAGRYTATKKMILLK